MFYLIFIIFHWEVTKECAAIIRPIYHKWKVDIFTFKPNASKPNVSYTNFVNWKKKWTMDNFWNKPYMYNLLPVFFCCWSECCGDIG